MIKNSHNSCTYRSNGKVMLTGEYLVLQGAKSIALPSKFGQVLRIEKRIEKRISWTTTVKGNHWFMVEFSLPQLQIISTNRHDIAKTLQIILYTARTLNADFLNDVGFEVLANIEFDLDWGLGSSSSLISNIAKWAKCDAFELNRKVFKGSGYDVACANATTPILFNLENEKAVIEAVKFCPSFSQNLHFVWLNRKQNTRDGIAAFDSKGDYSTEILKINEINTSLLHCDNLLDFQDLIEMHESIIASVLKTKTVKERFFSDFNGAIKSLGAWGGDFILVASELNESEVKEYFKQRGFQTVLSYNYLV